MSIEMDLLKLSKKIKKNCPIVQDLQEPVSRLAAVLVPLFQKNGCIHVLMTKRSLTLKMHPGEISFPGGTFEKQDENLLTTALRETQEEIDWPVQRSAVIGSLEKVTTRSGYEITPFVTTCDTIPPYGRLSTEVLEVLEIPLHEMFRTSQPDRRFHPSENMGIYWHNHHRVWGASAKILRQLELLAT